MGSYTSSERRGILIIAALALTVTGAGLIVSHCNRPAATLTPQDVEVLYRPASQGGDSIAGDSLRKNGKRKDGKAASKNAKAGSKDGTPKAGKSKSGKPKKEQKVYRRRSPIDEPAQ